MERVGGRQQLVKGAGSSRLRIPVPSPVHVWMRQATSSHQNHTFPEDTSSRGVSSPSRSSRLPEEQRADVCSVTICILLDSIIISITPSFHPRSHVFSGNRDGWSLFATSQRGGMSHTELLGTLSLVTDGEVTEGAGRARGWIPSGKQGNAAKLSISSPAGGEALSSASVPTGREAAYAGVGAEHRKPSLEVQGVPGAHLPLSWTAHRGGIFFFHTSYYFGSAGVK